jgi:hypothetical protein
MILAPPAGFDVTTPNRDMAFAHPWLRSSVARLQSVLELRGYPTKIIEVFRYDLRQQWLFGAGRTAAQCAIRGVGEHLARPLAKVVTNAWSAATTAHGHIEQLGGAWVPASCAVDIVPVGADGIPFTADDPWDDFTGTLEADANACGLRHFRNSAGHVSDLDHLQLSSWNDATHTLDLTPPPLMAA